MTHKRRKNRRREVPLARLDTYAALVLSTLRRRRLAGAADAVLVAVSAGPDSTALLAALDMARAKRPDVPFLFLSPDDESAVQRRRGFHPNRWNTT